MSKKHKYRVNFCFNGHSVVSSASFKNPVNKGDFIISYKMKDDKYYRRPQLNEEFIVFKITHSMADGLQEIYVKPQEI